MFVGLLVFLYRDILNFVLIFFLFSIAIVLPSQSYAACTNPAGVSGTLEYFEEVIGGFSCDSWTGLSACSGGITSTSSPSNQNECDSFCAASTSTRCCQWDDGGSGTCRRHVFGGTKIAGFVEAKTCSNPTGSDPEYKFCNGTDWISFSLSDLTACSAEAQWQWDATELAYKFCDGATQKRPDCIWDSGNSKCYDEGACTKTSATGVINNKYVVCSGTLWEVFAQ